MPTLESNRRKFSCAPQGDFEDINDGLAIDDGTELEEPVNARLPGTRRR